MIRIEEQKHKCLMTVEDEMTIYNASELQAKIFPLLSDPRELEIDLENVSEIDSAGVQLLMLARKDRAERGQVLTLTKHSSAVFDVFELMDLLAYFKDPVILPGVKGDKRGN